MMSTRRAAMFFRQQVAQRLRLHSNDGSRKRMIIAPLLSSLVSSSLFATSYSTSWKQPQWRVLSTARSVNNETPAEGFEVTSVTTTNEAEKTPHAFASLPGLHPSSLHAVTHKLHISTMTEIQQKTFMAAASGRDVLGRARTGTGKTLAFLLPSIESALRLGRVPGPHYYFHTSDSSNSSNDTMDDNDCSKEAATSVKSYRGGVAILILCPTRELAMQIHSQAQILCASHSNGSDSRLGKYNMTSQVMYGGTSKLSDVQKFNDTHPFILVATPGRLIDHIQSSRIGGGAGGGGPSSHNNSQYNNNTNTPFIDVIQDTSIWVLDEADRCLDMGFQKSMEYILSHKKKNDDTVQTLLFSATLPPDLRQIMGSHMRRNYLTVDCVKDVDPATHTNANVDQSYVTLPSPPPGNDNESRYISGLVDIIEDVIHVTNPTDYKIVVFFSTTALCEFFSHIFNTVYKLPVLEIHSRKAQSNRTMISDKFRKFPKGILFTTDVSARGVDYPNVTHVIQFGSAENRETYIHRLGRTGRAGRLGRGIIICGTLGEEKQFVHCELKGLNVRNDGRYQKLLNGEVVVTVDDDDSNSNNKTMLNACMKRKEINTERLNKIMTGIGTGSDTTLQKMGNNVYRSLLGYNMTKMSNLGVRSKDEVVSYVNSCAVQLGYSRSMPRISPKVAQTLGLMGVHGVNVGVDYGSGSSNAADDSGGGVWSNSRGGGRGGGGRGGGRVGGRGNYDRGGGRGGRFGNSSTRNGQSGQSGGRSYEQYDDYSWDSR